MIHNWHIGTSGWSYDDWKHKFYPKGHLSGHKHLPYFSRHFSTTEINATFYRIIKEETIQGWYNKTPENFIFSIKLHQYLTHSKRLKMDEAANSRLDLFLKSSSHLKEKAGPVLVQLPPGLKEDHYRLKDWLESMPEYRYAIEFRHDSWLNDKTAQLLSEHNAAMVYSHSPDIPSSLTVTANFLYVRFHGPKEFYKSKYTEDQLQKELKKIQSLDGLKNCRDIFIYFNNNYKGFAIDNARYLQSLIK